MNNVRLPSTNPSPPTHTTQAGISLESTHPTPHGIHHLSESDWDTNLLTNAKTVFLGSKYAITQMLHQPQAPTLRSRGWIVNTASVQGLVAYHHTRNPPFPFTL